MATNFFSSGESVSVTNVFVTSSSSGTSNFFDVSQSVIQGLRYIPQYATKPDASGLVVGTIVYDTTENKFFEVGSSGWIEHVWNVSELNASVLTASTLEFTSGSGTFLGVDSLSASNIVSVSGSIDALTVDSVQFDVDAGVVAGVGEVAWNNTDQTLNIGVNSSVTLQVGQEIVFRGRNDTSASIANGTVVYVTGALGNRPTIAPACANAGAPCSGKVVGVTTQAIAKNADGFVTTQGLVRGLDTREDFADVSLSAGDALYLSTTPGEWVKTVPASPAREVRVGYVTRVNPAVGEIYVEIDNGRTLEELHDVNTSSASSNDVLIYDSSNSVWQHVSQANLNVSRIQINAQTGVAYTLVAADAGKLVTCSNAAAVTVTVPPESSVNFDVGAKVGVAQLGAGAVSVAGGSGVTVSSLNSNTNIAGQYGVASLVKTGSDAWLLEGDLA